MSINMLSDTIDNWVDMVREFESRKDHRAADQARNWLRTHQEGNHGSHR